MGMSLIGGNTSSCGCFYIESRTKHSMSQAAEFRVWSDMKQRCNNPNNARYKDYGARGISVCLQWENNFEQFYKDMGARPSKTHSIDRINNNGNYEPGNCRWATRSQQQRNRRDKQLV